MKKPERPPIIKETPSYSQIMDELIQINKFSKFFEIDDTEYPYWDDWKYKTKGWGIEQEKNLGGAKSNRRGKKNYTIFCNS